MNNDIAEIKSRLNIVDVIGEYLRLEKAGNNYRALCPFHNEKSPSFMISEEKQMWHCFGCQKGGDMFSFVMEIEGLEFREVLKLLAEKAGVQLSSYNPEKKEKENRTLEILELATKFYEVQLWKGSGKTKILDYLKNRGFSEESIRNFRLGYAPQGWRNIFDFLQKRNYKKEEIEKTGLLVKKDNSDFYDRFRDRIIFPIADTNSRILGFSARVAPGGDESQAKYVNTPETDAYHKSRVLYGIDKAKIEIKKQDFVLLVEGNADVVASHQAGIKNTVAVSGTALTQEQIQIIKRYTKNVYLFFDMDSAGQIATRKSVKLCFENEMNVRVVSITQGKDAADIVRDNPEEFRLAVKKALSATEYFLNNSLANNDKESVEGRKKIIDEMLDLIASFQDEIEKDFWIKRLVQELDIREEILTNRLKKSILESRRSQSASAYSVSPKKETQEGRSNSEIILEKIVSLMLVFPDVWKNVYESKKLDVFADKNELLDLLLRKGEENKFSFNNLIDSGIESEKRSLLENMFFNQKFQSGINNNIEELEIADPLEELKNLLRTFEIENKKEILLKISKDQKVAKRNNDKETENFLRKKTQEISAELAKLIRQS